MGIVPTIVFSPDGITPRSIVLESSRNAGLPTVFDAEEAFFPPKPLHPETETNNTILSEQRFPLIIPNLLRPNIITRE
jgi:hypothetical protein